MGIEVEVREPGNEYSFKTALTKFSKMVDKSGILQEAKDRRYFMSNRELRKRKQIKARKVKRNR